MTTSRAMKTSGSSGRQRSNSVVDSRRVARGLCRSGVLAALAAVVFLASGIPLFAQHSSTGTASLGLTVAPAVQLTDDNTNAYLWIRLGTGGAGSLWGDSTSTCTSPITGATSVASSGKFTYSLSSIPFTTSDAYVCALDPADGTPLTASAVWPHTDASLKFSTQPTNTQSGASISPAVTVQILDSNGLVDTTNSTASVSLAITGGGTLSGTTPQTAVNGVATFNDLSIAAGGTYTLTATSGPLTLATSSSFSISGGTLDHFKVEKSGGGAIGTQTAGTAFNLRITAQDVNNNTVTSFTSTATLTSNGTLTGSPVTSGSFVAGVLDPQSVTITNTGSFTITATASGKTGTSAAFTVNPGPATQLVFTTQPSGGDVSTAFPIQPVVTIEDANGNTVTSSSASVTLALTGSGTLTCPTSGLSVTPVSGVATFAGCQVGTAGTGDTLKASTTSPALSVTSTTFNITSAATKLVFSTSTFSVAAATCSPMITVQTQNGSSIAAYPSSTVTVALSSNSTGTKAFYSDNGCTASITSVTIATSAETASFYYKDTKAASPVITAGATGPFTSSPTQTETVTVGPAAQLAFTTQPGGGTGGTAWSTQPAVKLEDAGGNTVTGTAQNVTLAIQNNAGPGGVLSGTTMVAVNTGTGVATFSGLSINTKGTGYTLTATGSTVDTTAGVVVSNAFNITLGGVASIGVETAATGTGTVVSTQNLTAGNSITVYAIARDAGGNFVANESAQWSLTSTTGGVSQTADMVPSGASATTSAVFTARLTGSGIIHVTYAGFSGNSGTITVVAGAASQLVFTTQPGGGTGGTAWTTQPAVTVEDAGGNTVTGAGVSVTLAIGTNPGGGTLTCTGTGTNGTTFTTAASGLATATGCKIDKIGTGYTLTASSSGLSTGTSSSFNITAGSATHLVITGTGTQTAGASQTIIITAKDAGGNTATSYSGSYNLTFSGASSSPNPVTNPTVTNNSASAIPFGSSTNIQFSLGILVGAGGIMYLYDAQTATISATDTTNGISSSGAGNLTVVVSAATTSDKLVFTTQPGGATHGLPLSPQPVVTVEDSWGNTVTTSSASITLSITTGTPTSGGPGTLTCTGGLSKSASSGVATFSGCSINTAGNGYKLHTASGSLTAADSTAFNMN